MVLASKRAEDQQFLFGMFVYSFIYSYINILFEYDNFQYDNLENKMVQGSISRKIHSLYCIKLY